MKIESQITTFCPYCNKHTVHKVKIYHSEPQRGQTVGARRHYRAIKGYVGKAEAKIQSKKLAKKQKLILECNVCKKSVERVMGGRAKKKIEIKR
jgi:large subunit ribosomal protein L44e